MEGSGGGGRGGDGTRVPDVVVMRHGDRVDHFEPLWVAHAPRPWDPLLTDGGRIRAWSVGKRLRAAGFMFHRVLVSPFLCCLQTASEVVRALCAVVEDESSLLLMENGGEAVLHPSRVKSSVEALLPAGTVDHSAERIYHELPEWQEYVLEVRNRYATVIQALADKYPDENLLLVTHGKGVGVSVSSFLKDSKVHGLEYCACSHL